MEIGAPSEQTFPLINLNIIIEVCVKFRRRRILKIPRKLNRQINRVRDQVLGLKSAVVVFVITEGDVRGCRIIHVRGLNAFYL